MKRAASGRRPADSGGGRRCGSASPPVSVFAPAKINLALEVVGKRPDGYHELVTIFQSLRLEDRLDLELSPAPGVALVVSPTGIDLGPPEGNLVSRAAYRLLEAAGQSDRIGVKIRLTKRIPVGAGLGGGSSDAAATLLGLSHLLRSYDSTDAGASIDLSVVAAALGADVPFFLVGGTQLATGVGEILRPLPPWPRHPLVVVFPNVGVSTSSVFRRFRTGLTPPGPLARIATLEISSRFWERDWNVFQNDLEPLVAADCAAVGEVLAEFERLGSPFARMSGSGSAVFGVAPDDAQAQRWADVFRARGFWARTVRPARVGCRLRVPEAD